MEEPPHKNCHWLNNRFALGLESLYTLYLTWEGLLCANTACMEIVTLGTRRSHILSKVIIKALVCPPVGQSHPHKSSICLSLSCAHVCCYVISPSSLLVSSFSLACSRLHFVSCLVHLLSWTLDTCPAQLHLISFTFSMTSMSFVFLLHFVRV